ncbi:menaquinone biosynthesis protein [Maridesulfovibrio bastinii]|uniref:menaquinone biosynthesis protein n=1 Tax=Maridesulfovibrio bastinii TaxID=47157 RepID=UPI0003FEB34E|nr:menaquinone biosynthesis protein [Maridesulfovibrio bastinii]
MAEKIRVGRISYLNVLPIYYPLESEIMGHNFEFFYGPPAHLNKMMSEGLLDIASTSSVEYLRHSEQYHLLPDLAIGSCGPVQSVILLSRCPVEELSGKKILASAQSHTSAVLLRLLLSKYIPVNPFYETGNATAVLNSGERPNAILAIGDEALNLRHHEDYPYLLDLGEAWREWTTLPFIFGVWIIQKESAARKPDEMREAVKKLIEAKKWGQRNILKMAELTAENSLMDAEETNSYYKGLVYDLEDKEIMGLKTFGNHLVDVGELSQMPKLDFFKI